MTPTHHRDREQPIGVLIPKPLADRPRPRPAPILDLPVPRPPVDLSAVELVLGVACPDRSGRVTESAVLQALHWGPGQRIDVRPRAGILVIVPAPAGRHVVGSRGELPLPSAVRKMCGVVAGQPLLLAAFPSQDLLVIHPARTVARLLADLHVQAIGGGCAG
jgi:hypothetical protein